MNSNDRAYATLDKDLPLKEDIRLLGRLLADPVRRAVQPWVGRLVLFPSYTWHGTVPFHAPQNRTTIAFDAIPAS